MDEVLLVSARWESERESDAASDGLFVILMS